MIENGQVKGAVESDYGAGLGEFGDDLENLSDCAGGGCAICLYVFGGDAIDGACCFGDVDSRVDKPLDGVDNLVVVVVVEDGCGDNAVGGVIDAGGFGVEGEVAVFVLEHEVSLSSAGGIAVLLCLYCTSIFRCLCDIWAHMSLYDK